MQKSVKEFMIASGQTVYINNDEQSELYETLIAEELEEFTDAVYANDAVGTLDACMDMIWVILGYCYSRGFKIDDAWNEVARSNLAKIDSKTGKVLKREDGKILKPDNWSPPNLNDCVLQKTLDKTK